MEYMRQRSSQSGFCISEYLILVLALALGMTAYADKFQRLGTLPIGQVAIVLEHGGGTDGTRDTEGRTQGSSGTTASTGN